MKVTVISALCTSFCAMLSAQLDLSPPVVPATGMEKVLEAEKAAPFQLPDDPMKYYHQQKQIIEAQEGAEKKIQLEKRIQLVKELASIADGIESHIKYCQQYLATVESGNLIRFDSAATQRLAQLKQRIEQCKNALRYIPGDSFKYEPKTYGHYIDFLTVVNGFEDAILSFNDPRIIEFVQEVTARNNRLKGDNGGMSRQASDLTNNSISAAEIRMHISTTIRHRTTSTEAYVKTRQTLRKLEAVLKIAAPVAAIR